jgi:putative acetyltransferase
MHQLLSLDMFDFIRTDSDNEDFRNLVKELDAELAIRDGKDHLFYAQYNRIDTIKHVIVAYENKIPVGCGAIKIFSPGIMEVKRMYVPPLQRGKGIASGILKELEGWVRELKFSKCILETGIKQPEALMLYKKCGYTVIPNYGQYENVKTSVCFEKSIF